MSALVNHAIMKTKFFNEFQTYVFTALILRSRIERYFGGESGAAGDPDGSRTDEC